VNRIITIADHIKNILNEYYRIKNNKIKTIYNGIDLDEINRLKEEEIKEEPYRTVLNNKTFLKFITMGRLIPIKGHEYLINAFAKLKKEYPKTKLFILGEGPLKKSLVKLANKKNLDEDIFFLGLKSNPYKFLYKSDIFILPSLIEGLPMSIIEAMACELPVIATRCKSGIEEILEDGEYGILVNRKDTSDLARKMIELSKDPSLREKYSQLSSQRAQFFDVNRIIKSWVKIIEREIALKR
jgi:glycosyltransferase involved in cell wall biosynthesis